LDRPQKFT